MYTYDSSASSEIPHFSRVLFHDAHNDRHRHKKKRFDNDATKAIDSHITSLCQMCSLEEK